MIKGYALLTAWIKERGMPAAEMARRIGVTEDSAYNYLHERRVPELRVAVALRDLTGIPVEAWVDVPENPTAD